MDSLTNSQKMNSQSYYSLYKQSKEPLSEKIQALRTQIISPETYEKIGEEKITEEARKRVACFIGTGQLTSDERLGKIQEAEAQLLSRENNAEIEKGWSPVIFERLSRIFPEISGEQIKQSCEKALTLWRKLLYEKEASASQEAIKHENCTHIHNNTNFFHSLAYATSENIATEIALLDQQIAAQRKLIEGGREKAINFIQSLTNQASEIAPEELAEMYYWLKKAVKQPEEAIKMRLKELASLAFTFPPQNQELFAKIWDDKSHDELAFFFKNMNGIKTLLLTYQIDPNSIPDSLESFATLLNHVKILWERFSKGDNPLLMIFAESGKTVLGKEIIERLAPILPQIPVNTLEIKPTCENITMIMAELGIPLAVEVENNIENDGALAEVIGNTSAAEDQNCSDAAIAQIMQDEENIEAPAPHEEERGDNIIFDAELAHVLQIEENQAVVIPSEIISQPSSSPQELNSPLQPIEQLRPLAPAAIAITPPERPAAATPNAAEPRISRAQRLWRQVLSFFARPLRWLSNAWNWFINLFSLPR